MTYRYEFDDTRVSDLRFDRGRYEVAQYSSRLLEGELTAWNQRAREHGAVGEPYAREVSDLAGMIEWGDARPVRLDVTEITVRGISVGGLRYIRGALLFTIRRRVEERQCQANEGCPDGAL